MIIPNIKKKIEKFISSETGLISKKKLISAGVTVAAASILLKSDSVVATHGSVDHTYSQADVPAEDVATGADIFCSINPPQTAHISCSDHASWGDDHASCSDGPKKLYFTRTCYSHSDNFVPSVGSDGATVVSTHSHAYASNTMNDVEVSAPKGSAGDPIVWLG